jgi:ubiquinone/menaquinone biosynthesis C-methylase UbiE
MNIQDIKRKKQFAIYGYDIKKERNFIIESALPFAGKILEAGTGKGNFSILLAKKGYKFVSFDISKTEQDFAKIAMANLGLEQFVDFIIENGENLSFKNESFDTIFSVNTLHHINQSSIFLDELSRVVTKNGKIILSDFTDEGFDMLDKIHESEGDKHEKNNFGLKDAEIYLNNKKFKTSKTKTKFQEVLIAWI